MIVTTSDAVDDLQSMGPVDFLVVEYPNGQITGEPYPYLVSLLDTATIYILDIAFIIKEADGSARQIALADLPEYAKIDLSIFDGASSGMLSGSDILDVGNLLQAGSLAVIVVFENLWAAPFAAALRRSGAQLVAHGRIPVRALLDALDSVETGRASELGQLDVATARGMPGLLRGVARTSLAAAQAVSVSNRISRLHRGSWTERDLARALRPDANPAEASSERLHDAVSQLAQLAKLRTAGQLTEAEFEAKVGRLLMSNMAYSVRPVPAGSTTPS
jgi:hypothetical protein